MHEDTTRIYYLFSLAVGQKVLTAYFTHLGNDSENTV
jgi:hypothetical protein